jgi:protein O-GlcNAc transferase
MSDVNTAFTEAFAFHQSGDLEQAEKHYRQLIQQYGSHAPSLCNLGVILVRAGKIEEAEQQYQLALATTPNYPDAHYNLGNLYRNVGKFGPAAENYQACIQKNPKHGAAAFNLGLIFSQFGDMSSAVECFRLTSNLEPQNADAHARLGDALVRVGKPAEGVLAFRKAVALKPNDHRHLYNLGLGLANIGNTEEAGETISKALKLQPNYAEAHNALGLNLEAQGRKDDAIFHYQKAVELKPDLADGWSNLGTSLSEQGRADDAIQCLRESLRHRPNAPQIHSNLLLLLNYSSNVSTAEVAKEHSDWATRFAPNVPSAPRIPAPHDPMRKMRIAYISGDFRQHTVSGFIETLMKHHDRSKVEVFCYANVLRPDDTTEKFRKLADKFLMIGGMPDAYVFDQMRQDNIDVLIDLSGHTAGNRMQLLAERPAPLQCTLFGYPNTTGLVAVDYRITDGFSDPEDLTERLYAERLLRMPEVAWCYTPPAFDIPVTPLPCLTHPKKTFTFGCLNNAAKISEACLSTWIKLLQAIPGTRLILLGGQSNAGAKRLADLFTKGGVLKDRVEVLPRLEKQKYFEAYQQFDISLDPFPYNGGVTTGDSLWMGVPVLGLAGQSYVSRQGLMANATLGLADFVADTPETLIQLARQWTKSRDELAEIRADLRPRLLSSALADGPRYVRHLEMVIREAWANRLDV